MECKSRAGRAASRLRVASARFSFRPGGAMAQHPPFVWIDRDGWGRNVHAYFRRDFKLARVPAKAAIRLFADSRYLLTVNGAAIGHGPARHRGEDAEFDEHDLSAHLRPGANVIAVHVVSFGISTFFHRFGRGAFVAWGKLGTVDLATPGEWRCRRATGYDADSLPMSFTSPPIDVLDERADVPGWNRLDADLSGWSRPEVLTGQDGWGPLAPRSIPHLTQDELRARTLLGAYDIRDDEDLVSFRVPRPAPPVGQAPKHDFKWVFAHLWVHSPRAQEVPVGLWWGEHFLNGKEVERKPHAELLNRTDGVFQLAEGWNELFIKHGMCEASWDFNMALPRAAGLRCAATRGEKGEGHTVFTAGPFTDAEEEGVRALTLPFAPEALPTLSAGWVRRATVPIGVAPAVALAWSRLGARRDEPSSPDRAIAAERPTSTMWDLGHMSLGRVFVEYDAAPGTVIDVGFAEHCEGPRVAVLWRAMIHAADRVIARGGPGRFETSAPRGARYLQVDIKPPHGGRAKLTRVGVVQQIYPFPEVGSFACSDPAFDEIWAMGWRTLRMCAEDAYVDCPWRERHLYAGDFLPEFATTVAVSPDLLLPRRCLGLLAPADAPVTDKGFGDFALMPIVILAWYLDRTGDVAAARSLYPRYARTLEAFCAGRGEQGMVRSVRAFVDWINTEPDAELTTVNALASAACSAGARIARRLKLASDAKKWEREAGKFAAVVRRRCWDAEAGAFRDGFRGDATLPRHSLAASAWAALFAGATDAGRDRKLREHYQRLLPKLHTEGGISAAETSSYGGFHILGALYQAGHVDLAERFMREGWGSFIAAGSDTCWEVFPARVTDPVTGTPRYVPQPGVSQTHAWSSAPTFYLSSRALGVDCGFPAPVADPRQLVIAPESETLTWARGVVPHPAGPVSVSWRVEGDTLLVDASAPRSVRWRVRPRGRLARLRLVVNGRVQPGAAPAARAARG
jgi:hypothetical protein